MKFWIQSQAGRINAGRDEEALRLALPDLEVLSAMRRKWLQLCAVYLPSLWPARLGHGMLAVGERFLTKPVNSFCWPSLGCCQNLSGPPSLNQPQAKAKKASWPAAFPDRGHRSR